MPVVSSRTNSNIRDTLLFDPSLQVNEETRQKVHSLECYEWCWCDCRLHAESNSGLLQSEYIIEVVLHSWHADDQRNDSLTFGKMRANPVHTSDDGRAYSAEPLGWMVCHRYRLGQGSWPGLRAMAGRRVHLTALSWKISTIVSFPCLHLMNAQIDDDAAVGTLKVCQRSALPDHSEYIGKNL